MTKLAIININRLLLLFFWYWYVVNVKCYSCSGHHNHAFVFILSVWTFVLHWKKLYNSRLEHAQMRIPANLNFFLFCLFKKKQNTKSSLWVWTTPGRQPSSINCKSGAVDVSYSCVSTAWCHILNVSFLFHVNSLTKEAVHTSPTIGSNVEQITVRKTHFLVWDIGGQESLRASWYSYYCNTKVRITAARHITNEHFAHAFI